VFVGDDVTDEDAFEVVRPWGYGIRVGGVERASHAVARLPSPDAVTAFLEDWLEATAPEPEPPRA
jgi:trehalose-6-phosphatase